MTRRTTLSKLTTAICLAGCLGLNVAKSAAQTLALLGEGRQRFAAQDYSAALEAFVQADASAGGKSWPAAVELARTQIAVGRYLEAAATAQRALQNAADAGQRSEAHLQIARAHFWGWQRMDLEQSAALKIAEESLQQALETVTDLASPAHGLRAAALYELGRKPEAAEVLRDYQPVSGDSYDLGREIGCFLQAEKGVPPVNLKREATAGRAIVKPKARRTRRPLYPPPARDANEQGLVVTQTIFDAQGNVQCLRPLKGLPYGLTEAALGAVRKWKYHPATVDGRPVTAYYRVAVSFFLQ